jgi:hypothetical protein
VQEIEGLKRQGLSIQAISELTGYDRKTVRRYLLLPEGVPAYRPRKPQPSKLDAFKPYLRERLAAGVWNARVLLRELRGRSYSGSYTILTDWLRPQRESAQVVAVRRFETPPGKQGQVDWGHLGDIELDGREYKLWGFTLTLGYSRMMMAEAALDQKLGTLLRMHEEAFRQLDGADQFSLQPIAGRPSYPYCDDELRKVARDAYVSWQGSRYSVPWEYAGKQVWVRNCDCDVEIRYRAQRIARHLEAARKHVIVTQPEHHAGIPLGAGRPGRKTLVHLRQTAPVVEIRPLEAYESVAAGGLQ